MIRKQQKLTFFINFSLDTFFFCFASIFFNDLIFKDMQTFRFHFRKITLTAFMMLGVASLGWLVSCNKEAGVEPQKELVGENVTIKNFKSEEYLTFDAVKAMLEGKGTLKKAPAGYKSIYPVSDNYDIWVFNETSTGKIHEIYAYKDLETLKQVANQVCDKKFTNDGGVICCDDEGSECHIIVDECGNVCIILCLA